MGTCDFEPPEHVPRTSARAKLAPSGPRGLPACHGAESTRKDPRPEEKNMPKCQKNTFINSTGNRHTYLDLFSERARLAPPWPLTVPTRTPPPSITCWTFPASLCFLHVVRPCSRFLYIRVHFFCFFSFLCTRAAIAATPQPTATQQQYHNKSSRYIHTVVRPCRPQWDNASKHA